MYRSATRRLSRRATTPGSASVALVACLATACYADEPNHSPAPAQARNDQASHEPPGMIGALGAGSPASAASSSSTGSAQAQASNVLAEPARGDFPPAPPMAPPIASAETLRARALYATDTADRLVAVLALANQRSVQAADVLVSAAFDREPEIRYQAVLALGYLMADGFDADGRIRAALSAAEMDSDGAVARVARKALGGSSEP